MIYLTIIQLTPKQAAIVEEQEWHNFKIWGDEEPGNKLLVKRLNGSRLDLSDLSQEQAHEIGLFLNERIEIAEHEGWYADRKSLEALDNKITSVFRQTLPPDRAGPGD